MTDERTPYLNQHGTVIFLAPEDVGPYKAAGYRVLKKGELPPLQASEVAAGAVPTTAAVAPPEPDEVKRLRRAQAKDDGS